MNCSPFLSPSILISFAFASYFLYPFLFLSLSHSLYPSLSCSVPSIETHRAIRWDDRHFFFSRIMKIVNETDFQQNEWRKWELLEEWLLIPLTIPVCCAYASAQNTQEFSYRVEYGQSFAIHVYIECRSASISSNGWNGNNVTVGGFFCVSARLYICICVWICVLVCKYDWRWALQSAHII